MEAYPIQAAHGTVAETRRVGGSSSQWTASKMPSNIEELVL